MPKVNVYLPEPLATDVRSAGLPVSEICQHALRLAFGNGLAPEGSAPLGLYGITAQVTRQAIELAVFVAKGRDHGYVTSLHLLVGLIDQANGRVPALSRLGADPEAVQRDALATIGALDPGSLEFPPDVAREREAIGLPLDRFPANAPLGRMLTIEGRDVMRVAGDVAERRTGGRVAPTLTNEDLLYGLVASSASLASVVLERHGCGADQLIGALGEDWRCANASARATRKRRGRPSPLAGLVARVDELSARVAELEGRLE